MADEMGVGDIVREMPHRIPYLDALRTMANADVQLILGSNQPHYTASKLYPCLLSGNSTLAFIHRDSEVVKYASECGGVKLVTFHTDNPIDRKVNELADALQTLAIAPRSLPKANLAPIRHLLADRIAERFAAIAPCGRCEFLGSAGQSQVGHPVQSARWAEPSGYFRPETKCSV